MTLHHAPPMDAADELTALRWRLVHLEADNADLRQRIARDQRCLLHRSLVVFTWRYADGWPVEYVSPNVAVLLGYPADDLISGRIPYGSLVHPDDRERVAIEVQTSSADGCPMFAQEYRLLHASGATRWISTVTTVIRDPQGTITVNAFAPHFNVNVFRWERCHNTSPPSARIHRWQSAAHPVSLVCDISKECDQSL